METAKELIKRITGETEAKIVGQNNWGVRHVNAWKRQKHGFGMGLSRMICGLGDYADDYRKRFEGQTLGEDYVLGVAWLDILKGVNRLLDGELDGLDGGTCSTILGKLAEREGLEIDS